MISTTLSQKNSLMLRSPGNSSTAAGSSGAPGSGYSGSMALVVDSSINKNRWTGGKEIPLTPLPSVRPLLAPRLRSSSPIRRSTQERERDAVKLMQGRYPCYIPGVSPSNSVTLTGNSRGIGSNIGNSSSSGSSGICSRGSSSTSLSGSSNSIGSSGGSRRGSSDALRWLSADSEEISLEGRSPQRGEEAGHYTVGHYSPSDTSAGQGVTTPALTREQFDKIQRMVHKRRQSAKKVAYSADCALGGDTNGSGGGGGSSSSGNRGSNSVASGGYGSGYHSRMRARRERTRRSCSVGSVGEVVPQGRVGGASVMANTVVTSREFSLGGPSPLAFSFGNGTSSGGLPLCDADGANEEQHGLNRVQQQHQQQHSQQEQQHHRHQHQHQQQDQVGSLTRECTSAKLEQSYELEGLIGRGPWGIVTACRHRGSGERFACKTVYKRLLEEDGRMDQLRNEVSNAGTPYSPPVGRLNKCASLISGLADDQPIPRHLLSILHHTVVTVVCITIHAQASANQLP